MAPARFDAGGEPLLSRTLLAPPRSTSRHHDRCRRCCAIGETIADYWRRKFGGPRVGDMWMFTITVARVIATRSHIASVEARE